MLLQRGSAFRHDSTIKVNKGITIGAYGSGAKPIIYGSTKNYAIDTDWVSYKENIYTLSTKRSDIGIIVFNHGEAVGYKKLNGISEFSSNGDFYHDLDKGILYIYMNKGSPDEVYESIEIGSQGNMFMIGDGVSNVTIDNLCIKYVGSHGIGTKQKNNNIVITNNEIGWIGGSVFMESTGINTTSRYGNAIQFWADASDCYVANNWTYQCYDTGITFQGRGATYTDLIFENNLMEYNTYNFEFFNGNSGGTDLAVNAAAVMKNIYIRNNIMRMAGYGWGQQRPETPAIYTGTAHITSWQSDYLQENIENFVISNNILDCSAKSIVYWRGYEETNYDGMTISDNTIYHKINPDHYEFTWLADAINVEADSSLRLKTELYDHFDATANITVLE